MLPRPARRADGWFLHGAAAAALSLLGCASLAGGADVHGLPVIERERPVPSAPRITDWIWPFGHIEDSAGSRSEGFRPFWREVNTDRGTRTEILYPLYRTSDERDVVTTRLFPIYWHDAFPTSEGMDTDTAVLPFLFWGNEPGQGGYFLFFPFGGHVKQKFLSDETTFVLFPLYAGTRNGAWRGTHVLWPLIHGGSDGKGHRAFRALPFYGMHVKEGRFDRRSLLWPVVHWGTENMNTPFPVKGWFVFPLLGHTAADDGFSTWTALWPFFEWADGPLVYERSIPYPFFRRRMEWESLEGGGRRLASDLLWLWPFYGRFDRGEEEHTRFYLWPLISTWDVADGSLRESGWSVAPLWRRIERTPVAGGPGSAWWKFWPLAQGETRADGGTHWSALAPLPWFRWDEFDANWGVFFELARRRTDPDGSTSLDLLFSLLRFRSGPDGSSRHVPLLWKDAQGKDGSSWNVLEGLVGGETDAAGRSSLRLLWFLRIPTGGHEP